MKKNRTWNWQDFLSWNETVWDLLRDIVTPAVVLEFKRSPPEYIVGDDLTWLDEIVERTTGDLVDTQAILTDRISRHYYALRAFHGSRPLDKDSFYKGGIYPLEPASFEKRAHELFLDGSFPELDVESIQMGIKKVGRKHREGLLYFEANESHLIEHCAHYMLYGSEYLCAIAANIPGVRDYRQYLKNFGSPTIFECDVPLSLMDSRLLREFAGGALESMFSTLIDPSFKHASACRGAGLYIRESLPSKCIVGHKSPAVLKDPLLGYTIYQEVVRPNFKL